MTVQGNPARIKELEKELDALRAVGRAIVELDDQSQILNRIAREAARVVRARAASILLDHVDHLEVAGAYRLGARYKATLENPPPANVAYRGPASIVTQTKQHFLVEDTDSDKRYRPWRLLARDEGFRAIAVIPLFGIEGALLGTLDVYRATPGPWLDRHVQMLVMFADHVSTAIRTTHLIERQRDQLAALERLVDTLREQRHEHVNRIHAIGGLLALDKPAEAAEFIASLKTTLASFQDGIQAQIGNPTVAGLLVSHTAIAEQRGVTVELAPASTLDQLPKGMSDADAITVLGNLLDNAVDAVAEQPAARRRVSISLSHAERALVWVVADRGGGVAAAVRGRECEPHISSKRSHDGLGLFIVSRIVGRLGGQLSVSSSKRGATFSVTLPLV